MLLDDRPTFAITGGLSNSQLMVETGVTVGNYNAPGSNLYTIRFRDSEEIGIWLASLYSSQIVIEAVDMTDQRDFWEKVSKLNPLNISIDYFIESGSLALFEKDNGYDLIDSSLFLPLLKQLEDIPQDVLFTLESEVLKFTGNNDLDMIFKLITGRVPEIGVELSQFLNINYSKSDEIRDVIGFLLVDAACPDYKWENGIFSCDGISFGRTPLYGNGIQNDMGYIPITDFDNIDIQFKSTHRFPRVGSETPPTFTTNNLRYFIHDAYQLLTNQKATTPIKDYVSEAIEAYNFKKSYSTYAHTLNKDYDDKIFTKFWLENKGSYVGQTIGFYYNDTTLAKDNVPLVFITKYSRDDWEQYDLESSVGPHEKMIKEGEWVYLWSLPGEHPYEPFGTKKPEAKEWLEIFQKISAKLEDQEDSGKQETLEWQSKQNVDKNHNWTIKFNERIDPTSIHEGNFYVEHKGDKIKGIRPYLSADRMSVIIEAPSEGYLPGETYQLYINNAVKSETNKTLQSQSRMEFTIENVQMNWEGQFKRAGLSNQGFLEIKNIDGNSFDFFINVTSGAHADEIEGKVQIKGQRAYYDGPECDLIFIHHGDSIEIEQKDGCIRIATSFSGKYSQNQEDIEYTLLDRGIFSSKDEDQKFQQLVKSDYETFVGSMQLINGDERYDYEVNGKIFVGFVRGLATIMEGIIIIGENGHLYAAVIEDMNIHYYTTNPTYMNNIPNSIKEWKKHFDHYPVKYMSKS